MTTTEHVHEWGDHYHQPAADRILNTRSYRLHGIHQPESPDHHCQRCTYGCGQFKCEVN